MMNKKYMISLSQDYPVGLVKSIGESGYFFRKVEDINQLIEKIRIFDAGLNDIVVEIMKNVTTKIMKLNTDMLFAQAEKDGFIFLLLKEEKAISVPKITYDMVLKNCTKEDLKEYPEFMEVNQSYIEKLIK